MDHIDKMLATSLDSPYKFSVAIRAALAIGKSAMSEVDHITMGLVFYYSNISYVLISIYLVLHPRHKLEYFKKHNWEESWIQTAHEIVREEFDRSYAAMDVGVDEGSMQVDSNNDTVRFFLLLLNFRREFMTARQTPRNRRISLMISRTSHSHHRSNVMNLTAICLPMWKMLRMASFGGTRGAHSSLVYHVWPVIIFQFQVSIFKLICFNILYLWTFKLLLLM